MNNKTFKNNLKIQLTLFFIKGLKLLGFGRSIFKKILFNILNGYNEGLYYRIINVPLSFGIKDYKELENKLLTHKFIDFVKINRINKSNKEDFEDRDN